MEVSPNLIIGFMFLIILILLFAKINVSVSDQDGNPMSRQLISSNKRIFRDHTGKARMIYNNINNNMNNDMMNNNMMNNISLAESQGLPDKNDYMSDSLRQQLNDLENKFYYNNCRFEPNM